MPSIDFGSTTGVVPGEVTSSLKRITGFSSPSRSRSTSWAERAGALSRARLSGPDSIPAPALWTDEDEETGSSDGTFKIGSPPKSDIMPGAYLQPTAGRSAPPRSLILQHAMAAAAVDTKQAVGETHMHSDYQRLKMRYFQRLTARRGSGSVVIRHPDGFLQSTLKTQHRSAPRPIRKQSL